MLPRRAGQALRGWREQSGRDVGARANPQHVAKRAQEAAQLRGGGQQLGDLWAGEEILQLAARARDAWDQADEPAEGAR